MKYLFLAVTFLLLLCSCQSEKKVSEKNEYLRWVGDIEKNEQTDRPDFELCNGEDHILQYFNFGNGPVYSGEKLELINLFNSKYIPVTKKSESGLIRIRFVVNCKGKAGRFRVIQSDENYQEKEFDPDLINQLVDITKGIENWEILDRDGFTIDYYMYLVFKMKEGKITEILP